MTDETARAIVDNHGHEITSDDTDKPWGANWDSDWPDTIE